MTVDSLNTGSSKTIKWRGKSIQTGIYKAAVNGPLFLGEEDVANDSVVDRRYHGGIHKACYAYSKEAYTFWQSLYPDTTFNYGFFGENLTISGLKESEIRIGNQYKIGEAIIEVSQPREPCFKLGVRFGSQKILKPFINGDLPGIYFRVIATGNVNKGDELKLIKEDENELSVNEIFKLIYGQIQDKARYMLAIESKKLAPSAKKAIEVRLNKMTTAL